MHAAACWASARPLPCVPTRTNLARCVETQNLRPVHVLANVKANHQLSGPPRHYEPLLSSLPSHWLFDFSLPVGKFLFFSFFAKKGNSFTKKICTATLIDTQLQRPTRCSWFWRSSQWRAAPCCRAQSARTALLWAMMTGLATMTRITSCKRKVRVMVRDVSARIAAGRDRERENEIKHAF